MTTPTPPAAFVADGDDLVPTALAAGPWGQSLSGNIVGSLLAYAIERDEGGDPDLQPARLTVDLPRPVLLEPLRVRTSVIREGRRVKLVDAEVLQSGAVVARASTLFLRRGEQPPGTVWTTPLTMPALPPDADDEPIVPPIMVWAYGKDTDSDGRILDLGQWQHDGPKFAWVRDVLPLIEGVPMTPFTRAAAAGDVASSLTHFGTEGLHYINTDYTLTLSRLPEGSDVGLAALTQSAHGGVATGTAALFDRRGQLGSATATALANPGFTPPAQIRGVPR